MQVPESVSAPASPDPSTLGPSLSTSTFGPSLDPSTVVPAASDVLEASALPLPVTLPPQPHARKMHVATRCPRKQSRSTQGACAMDQPTTSAGLPRAPDPGAWALAVSAAVGGSLQRTKSLDLADNPGSGDIERRRWVA